MSESGNENFSRLMFSNKDIVIACFSIVAFLADIGTDIRMAYQYYSDRDWLFFGLTLSFVLVSSTVVFAINLYFYLGKRMSKRRWVIFGVFAVFLMTPVLRHIDVMRSGLKSRKSLSEEEEERVLAQAEREKRKEQKARVQEYELKHVNYKRARAVKLSLIESFMEAAPQLVLQLYIILSRGILPPTTTGGALTGNLTMDSTYEDFASKAPSSGETPMETLTIDSTHEEFVTKAPLTVILQLLTIATSLVSFALSLAAAYRTSFFSELNGFHLTLKGCICLFFWRIFEVLPRVLAMAAFLLFRQFEFLALVIGHWLAIWMWQIGRMSWRPSLLRACLTKFPNAFVGVFCLFDLGDLDEVFTEKVHWRNCVIYYTLVFIENTVMAVLGYMAVYKKHQFMGIILAVTLTSFGFSIYIMYLYYRLFHPKDGMPPKKDRQVMKVKIPDYFRPWISLNEQQLRDIFLRQYSSMSSTLTMKETKQIAHLLFSNRMISFTEMEKVCSKCSTSTETADALGDIVVTRDKKKLYCAVFALLSKDLNRSDILNMLECRRYLLKLVDIK